MEKEILIWAQQISKTFGATVALDGVDLIIRRGEIHGLIGENGSGKSTLSSIIAGMQKANSGEIYLLNQKFHPLNMIDALNQGVGMIVQESGTIPGITVAENIFLGETNRFRKRGIISRKDMNREAQEALLKIGVDHIDARALTQTVDYQDRKLIEIARVINKSPQVLIIDETTTALSQQGREIIYRLMDEFKEQNKGVIFISHDLDELLEKCNVLTVLRDGNLIQSLQEEQFDEALVKQLMVGREMKGSFYREDFDGSVDEEIVLQVDHLSCAPLKDVSLSLHKGEILGIGGLSHCGMHTLGKCIFGFEKPEKGSVRHIRTNTKITHEAVAMRCGLGYVSKDRDTEALSLNTSIKDNISIAGMDKLRRAHYFLFPKDEKKYVADTIDALSIKCTSMNQYVKKLSGGNKQKVVFGKWIARDSSILILDCPTRGVDIGVKQAMYRLIYQLKQEGKSCIIISEELSELIGMSDRILIMKDGVISGSFERNETLSEANVIGSMI